MRFEKKIIYTALFTGSVIFIVGLTTLPQNASYESPSFIAVMVGAGIAFVFAVLLISISFYRCFWNAPAKLSGKTQKIMKPLGQRKRSSGLKNPIIKSMRV